MVAELIEIAYEIMHFMHKNPIIYKVIMATNYGEVYGKRNTFNRQSICWLDVSIAFYKD